MHELSFLPQVVLILLAAVFIVAIFRKLNLSPVLGYLLAGALIGEHGISYVESKDLIVFADFGVVFLLFAIGLELTIDRLMAMRWHVFGFGSLQVIITSCVIGTISYYLGASIQMAVLIGGSLALSSTAIVLRVIADSGKQASQVGRISLANLLLQDFVVVPLLVLVPLLAKGGDDIGWTLASVSGKAFLAMFLIFFLGRMLLRPLFRLVASTKSSELFVATTLLIVLASSWTTHALGLSIALGAFIAGLLVAETQYQHQVEDSIMSFKDLLMGLFFMTIGMTIDLTAMYDKMWLLIQGSVALITIKAAIIIGLCKLFKFPWGSSIHAGLLLAQGSEFAFILFAIAEQPGIAILDPNTAQLLLMIVTTTMAVTPALYKLGEIVGKKLDKNRFDKFNAEEASDSRFDDLNKHVIVIGFGRVGEMVGRMLEAQKITYVIIEPDKRLAKEGREKGFAVFQGDYTKNKILEKLGIGRAKSVIVTVRDGLMTKKITKIINTSHPEIPIVVKSEDLKTSKTLKALGASVIVPETYEAGLQLAGAMLKAIGLNETEVSRIKNQFRAGDYKRAKEVIDTPANS